MSADYEDGDRVQGPLLGGPGRRLRGRGRAVQHRVRGAQIRSAAQAVFPTQRVAADWAKAIDPRIDAKTLAAFVAWAAPEPEVVYTTLLPVTPAPEPDVPGDRPAVGKGGRLTAYSSVARRRGAGCLASDLGRSYSRRR
jgi:hypothetical protein